LPQHRAETPFDHIESAHEFVSLLADAIGDAVAEIESDVQSAQSAGATRRVEALHLVHFKLSKLDSHIVSSRRILNDLRTLRRLLLEERHGGKPVNRASA
jgi:hypothetical protein